MVNRPKMDRNERAKQFMPFDAVKGLREALKEKENETEIANNFQLDREKDEMYNNDI